jgi:hypothetical protein
VRAVRLPLCIAAALVVSGLAPLSTSAAAPAASSPSVGAVPAPGPDDVQPVTPVVRRVPVRADSQAGVRSGLAAPHSVPVAVTGPEAVNGFAVAGVTWAGAVPAGLAMSVRTRVDGDWSRWIPLTYDVEHGPTAGSTEAARARPGTDPIVLGRVDDVQLKVTSDTGTLPREMELDLIDPGRSVGTPAPEAASSTEWGLASTELGVAPRDATGPMAAPRITPKPAIFTRSDWGADERLTDCCVEYGEVHAAFVHHTVNANNYKRAETPAIIRGIYAYHTQGRGWRDIGYNFLIDRFGRIWEGRAGGMALPVIGAHTLNYNEHAFAASAIGNFETARPRSAMIDAYARLIAWKLSLHGVGPRTRQLVGDTVFDAINGHRDAAQTACPGRHLYAQLHAIIAKAAVYQRPFVGRDLKHSFLRGPKPDALLLDRTGRLSVAAGTGAPGFQKSRVAASGFGDDDQVVPVGDVTGDGMSDVVARAKATGLMSVYPGNGDGTFGDPIPAGMRWAETDLITGPGDLDRDGFADLLARSTESRALLFYPGRGNGTFGAGRVALSWVGGSTMLAAAGDFDHDGFRDAFVRNRFGSLVVLNGTGTGTFSTQFVLVEKWTGRDLTVGGYDTTGDSWPDVVARDSTTGVIRTFANLQGTQLSPGVGALPPSPRLRHLGLSRDVDGDHKPDLTAVTRQGTLLTFPGRRQNWLSPARTRDLTWRGAELPMIVGDWNRDGHVDAMARNRRTGAVWLYRGTDAGGFAAPMGGWGNWSHRTMITPVGDFDGDGWPDLMARARNGRIYWHPGRGEDGFGKRRLARASGFPHGATVTSVGLWDRDGAPDVVVRARNGDLWLYPGNGPGGLEDPRRVGRRFDRYDRLVGVGDLTGDGQPDLLGRVASGNLWLIPGLVATRKRPSGAFGPRQFVASGWASYRFA